MANTLKFGNGQWATGNGTALAYNDENANFKPLPFDFTRASSGTTVNQSGLIETVGSGIPRIDFQGNTKGALLLEPSRTNYVKYSESIDSWSTGFSSLSPNAVTADYEQGPYSNTSADRVQLTINPSNTVSQVYQVLAITSGVYTASVWLKSLSGTPTVAIIDNYNTSGGFKLVTLTNDWVRHTLTFTATANDFIPQFLLLNGTTSSSADFLAYGFQVEQGSYATSYIPTSGSAVTRVADTSSQTLPSSVIGQTEGTIYCEFKYLGIGSSVIPIVLNNGTNSNRIQIEINTAGGGVLYVVDGGTFQASVSLGSFVGNTNYKIGIAYKVNDFVAYKNGVQIGSDNSGNVPSLTQIQLGQELSASYSGLKNQETNLYNTRLSNSELAALTTI